MEYFGISKNFGINKNYGERWKFFRDMDNCGTVWFKRGYAHSMCEVVEMVSIGITVAEEVGAEKSLKQLLDYMRCAELECAVYSDENGFTFWFTDDWRYDVDCWGLGTPETRVIASGPQGQMHTFIFEEQAAVEVWKMFKRIYKEFKRIEGERVKEIAEKVKVVV